MAERTSDQKNSQDLKLSRSMRRRWTKQELYSLLILLLVYSYVVVFIPLKRALLMNSKYLSLCIHVYIYVYDSLTLKLLSLTLIGVLFELHVKIELQRQGG